MASSWAQPAPDLAASSKQFWNRHISDGDLTASRRGAKASKRTEEPPPLEIQVRVESARGLRAEDSWTGSSDPYAIVRVRGGQREEQEIGRTHYQRRTLEPRWDTDLTCRLQSVPSHLEIHVYDRDIVTSDDPLGAGRITLPPEMFSAGPGEPVSRRFCCQLVRRQNGGAQGEVRVLVTTICHEGLVATEVTAPELLWDKFPPDSDEFKRLHRMADGTFVRWHPDGEVVLWLLDDFQRLMGGGSGERTGRLLLTSHRLSFLQSTASDGVEHADVSFWTPLGCIASIQVTPKIRSRARSSDFSEPVGCGLEVLLKDGREFKLTALPRLVPVRPLLNDIVEEHAWRVAEDSFAFEIDSNLADEGPGLCPRADHEPLSSDDNASIGVTVPECIFAWLANPLETQSTVFDIRAELQRQGIDGSEDWRITSSNEEYELCPTYPSVLAVPAAISDSLLSKAVKWRSKKRIPALTWLHPRNGASLSRCAQPLEGMVPHEMKEDRDVLRAIHATGSPNDNGQLPRLKVYDARSKVAATANAVMGGGHEDRTSLGGPDAGELVFLGIDNIHCMRNSLQALSKLCRTPGVAEQQKDGIDWLRHISALLRSAVQMATAQEAGHPLLVHCSDGWDRTSQLVALVQLLLDPFYRTMHGFHCLVEKDFCAFGHMFGRRGGLEDGKESSPIFLQWLDCVWQLQQQFSSEFEFNESFLSFLAIAHTSNWYGNFLGNNEKCRRAHRLASHTKSLWDCILHDADKFKNAWYKPVRTSSVQRTSPLQPACDLEYLRLWPHFLSEHMVWHEATQSCVQIGTSPWPAGVCAPENSVLLAHGQQPVPPKEEVRVPVEIDRTVMIWWKFQTVAPANTLHFSVQAEEGENVISRRKYHCREPVTGNCLCVAGAYAFVWDNGHSWLQTKGVVYEIHKATACSL